MLLFCACVDFRKSLSYLYTIHSLKLFMWTTFLVVLLETSKFLHKIYTYLFYTWLDSEYLLQSRWGETTEKPKKKWQIEENNTRHIYTALLINLIAGSTSSISALFPLKMSSRHATLGITFLLVFKWHFS